MNFTVIIPARMASTRLPGKPLLEIAGLPMIERVRRQALASGAQRVLVATDTREIADCIDAHGGEVIITRADHVSGTDRLAEVVERLALADDEIVVNLQGDEPLMPPGLLSAVAAALAGDPASVMATVGCPIRDDADIFNPNVVKLVRDLSGRAIYFSRAPIPWNRDQFATQGQNTRLADAGAWLRHIGLYAYRAGFLPRYSQWSATPLESVEALEQLRVLEHGERIRVLVAEQVPPAGVDTPDDLERIRTLLETTKAE